MADKVECGVRDCHARKMGLPHTHDWPAEAEQTAAAPGMLTPLEHEAIVQAGTLMGTLAEIVGTGRTREADLTEMCNHIHAIQNAVLAQAAARAYPDQYRLMGGSRRG